MLKRFCVLIAIIYLSLVLSCSQSTMEPGEVYARVLFVQTGESQATPRFSLFFAYTNTAGQNDFDKITVIHKASGVTWNLPSQICFCFKNSSLGEYSFLVGTNKMAFPADKVLKGEYIVSISKLNGQTKSKTVSISSPDFSEKTFPVNINFSIAKTDFTSEKPITKCSIILSGADRQPIFVSEIKSDGFSTIYPENIISEHKDAHYVQFLFEIEKTEFLSHLIEIEPLS